MNTIEFEKRLDRIEGRVSQPTLGRVVTIEPGSWPADVQEAYRTALTLGDRIRADDIIEQQVGARPVDMPGHINLIVISWDPDDQGPLVTIDDGHIVSWGEA